MVNYATAIPKSVVTTKGDLIAGTGNAAVARLAVGSDTQVLTADSTQTDGMKWAAAVASPLPIAQGGTGSATQNFVDLTTGQTVAGDKVLSGNLDCSAHALALWTPRESGLVASTGDPRTVPNGVLPTLGTIYLSSLYVSRSVSVTKILWGISVAGITPTAGQNFVALVDPTGAILASVNVDARVTSTGLFTETIASQALTPGIYRVVFLFNAATAPTVYRHDGLAAALINAGISAPANFIHATNGTGATALPGSFTLSANVSSSFALWAAIQQ